MHLKNTALYTRGRLNNKPDAYWLQHSVFSQSMESVGFLYEVAAKF